MESKRTWACTRVSTGIPGYGLRMEMIRKFFPFPLWKRFRKSGIPERFPERFFPRKPEISGTLFRNVPEYHSGNFPVYGTLFRNVPEYRSGKFPVYGTLFRNSGTFRKFLERYGTFRKFPERYGISFRKFSGKIVPEISGTIGTRIKLKPLRLM